MNIELIDTEVSRTNTYFFSSNTDRDNFFSKKVYRTIETSYYPPYYNNRIKLSTEDFNIFSSVIFNYVRYLRISYSNKYYYYFIDSIDYINEDVYELSISMDTYMTFMNNITLNDICIERKFINRYNSDKTFNRNYIRENVSKNQFDNLVYDRIINEDISQWVTIMKCSDYPLTSSSLGKYVTSYSLNIPSNVQVYNIPEFIGFTPYLSGTFNDVIISSSNIMYSLDNAYVTDCYVIPFNPFKNYNMIKGSSGYDIKAPYSKVIDMDNRQDYHHYVLYEDDIIQCNINSVIYNFGFPEQKVKNVPFLKEYVPAILDENYIRLTFGDKEVIASYPLYRLKSTNIYCMYWSDISTGTRYYMLDDNNDIRVNSYGTIVSNTNILSLTLRNDPWKSYIANNKATLANAIVRDSANTITNFYSNYFNFQSEDRARVNFLANPDTYDKRYSTPVIKKSKFNEFLNYKNKDYQSVASAYSPSRYSLVGDYIANENNLKFSPATISRFGQAQISLVGQSSYIHIQKSYCNDIEQVAQYYHHNGYLVNEWLPERKTLKQLVDYISTRYYFNILKLSSCDIKGYSLTLTADICDDLAARLQSGIRIWNNKLDATTFEDYTYDNVEVKYL